MAEEKKTVTKKVVAPKKETAPKYRHDFKSWEEYNKYKGNKA